MGPVLRPRVARGSHRIGNKAANCADRRCRVLADKTNRALRSRRKVASPQPDLGSEQRPCIYKLGNTTENQELLPEERLALYTFEVDENEPQVKKSKCKRKVWHRKKLDSSDATDDEYIPRGKKHLRSGVKRAARRKKCLTTGVTHHQKMTMENKENVSVAESNFSHQSSPMTCHDSNDHGKTEVENKESVSVADSTYTHHSNNVSNHEPDSSGKVTAESKESVSVSDSTNTCHATSVTCNELGNMMGNKEIVPVADMPKAKSQKPEIHRNLVEDLSVSESKPGQVSSSCRSILPFSPIEQHFPQPGTCMSLRQPGTSRVTWSVEDFTVENFFGFDEESEDEQHLLLSPLKMIPSLGTNVSIPVSSTPYVKPKFTRTGAEPMRLVHTGAKLRTAFMSAQCTAPAARSVTVPTTWSATPPAAQSATVPATWSATAPTTRSATASAARSATEPATWSVTAPTTRSVITPAAQSATAPAVAPLPTSELSLTSDVTPPYTVNAVHNPSSPILFMDENVPSQHFTKVSLTQGVVVFPIRAYTSESRSSFQLLKQM